MQKIIIFSAISLMLSACSNQPPREQWQKFSHTEKTAEILAPHQALAVFYRPVESHPKAVNLYINGDYQASLLAGSFTSLAVCGTKQLFSASISQNSEFGNRKEGANYTLPIQETAYLRVTTNQQGEVVLAKVDSNTAEEETKALKRVKTTVSRVKPASNCEPVIVAKDLSLNALFKFDKSAYQDLLPTGKQEITNFVATLKTLPINQINRIVVTGYTDPFGAPAYNRELSQRRAQTVAHYLKEAGVNTSIQAVGYGQKDLLIPDCAVRYAKNKAQQVACNQPNRRVEIAVYGH